jgi:hypothetical protein
VTAGIHKFKTGLVFEKNDIFFYKNKKGMEGVKFKAKNNPQKCSEDLGNKELFY